MNKILLLLLLTMSSFLFAARPPVQACPTLADLEAKVCCHYAKKEWEKAASYIQQIIRYYPQTQQAINGHYQLGLCFYTLRDFDLANRAFSRYLERDPTGKRFEEVMGYKFAIAEAFRRGECTHLFGARHLPKWLSADREAIEIYDEIIAVLPGQDLAVRSLWGKGCLLIRSCQYKEGREAFFTLITAFPRHPLAIESYLQIGCSYLRECDTEPSNSDLLSLACINLKKFQQAFPGEPRIAAATKMYEQMQECFAASIYDMAEFYERTCHPSAAIIYYKNILRDFPTTSYGRLSEKALHRLTCQ
jgi:outer membrane protein assembly factor BamD (BamD/ComL family)